MKTIILKGQQYNAKFDFRTLANIQAELKKAKYEIGIQEIFNSMAKQDFTVITEIIVQSILRCHPQLKKHHIEDKLDFFELDNVFGFVSELIEDSMPKSDKKADEGN